MKKGISNYILYSIIGSIVLFLFCYVLYVNYRSDIFVGMAISSLFLGVVFIIVLCIINIIYFIVDGMKKIKNFQGDELFVEIEKYRTYIKDDNHYIEMIDIINKLYNSAQFTQIQREKKISVLLKRKKFLEQNMDYYKNPYIFVDAILFFFFTSLFSLMIKIAGSSDLLFLGTMVLLVILEAFILFYKYSDFIEFNNMEYEIYRHELGLIDKAIYKNNNSKCNKKQYEMYKLKMIIHNSLRDLQKKIKFYNRKNLNNDIEIIKKLNVCDDLKRKKDYYNIEIQGETYKLYCDIKCGETTKDNISVVHKDYVSEIIINMIDKYKIGEIKKVRLKRK